MALRRLDHIGVTVADLDAAVAFFVGLGLEVEGRTSVEVDDLQGILDRLAAEGYGLVGGVGEYEGIWRMAHVREPEGIIVSLSERIG